MKFKQFLASKGITAEKFADMEANEQAKLHTDFLDGLETVSKTELIELMSKVKELETKGVDVTTLKSKKSRQLTLKSKRKKVII